MIPYKRMRRDSDLLIKRGPVPAWRRRMKAAQSLRQPSKGWTVIDNQLVWTEATAIMYCQEHDLFVTDTSDNDYGTALVRMSYRIDDLAVRSVIHTFHPRATPGAIWDIYGLQGEDWEICSSCAKAVNCHPTHYGWLPQYWVTDDGILCLDCLDPEEYITDCIEKANQGCTVSCNLVDPDEHGFVRILEDLEYGMYRGQNDDPRKLVQWANERNLQIVFTIFPSQFTVSFDLYIRGQNEEEEPRSLTNTEVEEITNALSVPSWGDHRALRSEFRQWPDPATVMSDALNRATKPFTRIDSDGNLQEYDTFDEYVESCKEG